MILYYIIGAILVISGLSYLIYGIIFIITTSNSFKRDRIFKRSKWISKS